MKLLRWLSLLVLPCGLITIAAAIVLRVTDSHDTSFGRLVLAVPVIAFAFGLSAFLVRSVVLGVYRFRSAGAGQTASVRRFSRFVWLVSALTYPLGVLAISVATGISTWRSVLVQLAAFVVFVVVSDHFLLEPQEGPMMKGLVGLACVSGVMFPGVCLHRNGRMREYWTDEAERIWRLIGYGSYFIVVMCLAGVFLECAICCLSFVL